MANNKKCLKCGEIYDSAETKCPACGNIGFKLVGDGTGNPAEKIMTSQNLRETTAEENLVGSFWVGFVVGLNPFGGLLAAIAFGQKRTLIGGICAFILRMILLVLIIVGIVMLVKHYR